MSPLLRVLHSTARALADLFCTLQPIADAHNEAPPVSTATLYLRLVASAGSPLPPPAAIPEVCARCTRRFAMELPRDTDATLAPPESRMRPAILRSVAVHEQGADESYPPSSGSDGSVRLPPTPTQSRRQGAHSARRPRPPLLYPAAPRLDATPPDIDLGLAVGELHSHGGVSEQTVPHLGLGLGLGLDITGLGILPRTHPAEPGAPSTSFLRDLHAAFVSPSSTLGSPPALSTGSLSPPDTASPPSFALSPPPFVTAVRADIGAPSDDDGTYDSDDDSFFLARPRPRPPVRVLKPRVKPHRVPSHGSLSPSPVPRSPTSPSSPQPELKPRSSLSIQRPPPSRTRSPRMLGVFDQDTVASAARRVSFSSVGSCDSDGRPRWRF
ncbi:hypothetical protein K488DRAFT_90051 [Vararia minispora EC-137]|uniref:Uncharacterized protein n=1 Tax=Vararia minispora EC-137 TaxID=1314806 RepID=A0ACB8Q950_9AGAM|nr:hypothetical protein K488DRAFT_90051 [Vararia minispora EC-137]